MPWLAQGIPLVCPAPWRDFSGANFGDELRECPLAAQEVSRGLALPWLPRGFPLAALRPPKGALEPSRGGAIPIVWMGTAPTNIKPPSAGVVCANVRCNGSAAPVIHLMGGAARHTRAQLCGIVRHWPCRSLAHLTSAALFWIRLWHRLSHGPLRGRWHSLCPMQVSRSASCLTRCVTPSPARARTYAYTAPDSGPSPGGAIGRSRRATYMRRPKCEKSLRGLIGGRVGL